MSNIIKKSESLVPVVSGAAESSPHVIVRGGLHAAVNRDGTRPHRVSRVIHVKLAPLTPEIWRLLRDLAWDAMAYKNHFLRARWAGAKGLRVDPALGDPHDVEKQIRHTEKGRLSGSAYSAAEREVQATWTRDAKQILAGRAFSEWRQGDALSIRGHRTDRQQSGVRLLTDRARFVLELQAVHHAHPGGSWVALPLANGVELDRYQVPILLHMLDWTIPITKAQVRLFPQRHDARVSLTYEQILNLAPSGLRVATLGPLTRAGRLILRADCDEQDYSDRLFVYRQRTADWDAIRRRMQAQIGSRKGAARRKRRLFLRQSIADWRTTWLHQWTAQILRWTVAQGIGCITVTGIADGDWPADRFVQMLRYKGEACGVVVDEGMPTGQSGRRAVKQIVTNELREARKARKAIRDLQDVLST